MIVETIMGTNFCRPLQVILNYLYVLVFRVDLTEHADLTSYQSLQDLFTRRLDNSSTRFSKNKQEVISPVDGVLTHQGIIKSKSLFQIKGHKYSLKRLLSDAISLSRLEGGRYFNLYLSPKNYHHYHAPCDLNVQRAIFIPGKCYPVNNFFLRFKKNLFVENKRVVLECKVNDKLVYLVFIGALNVGGICFNFDRNIANLKEQKVISYKKPKSVKKGEDMGYFKLGSTVVMIFEKDLLSVSEKKTNLEVNFGDVLGMKNGKV
jgi:phosphatidylserine decarboxylase